MEDPIVALGIGFLIGSVALSILMAFTITRIQRTSSTQLEASQATIQGLRSELAEDKENNRMLRYQLSQVQSGRGPTPESETSGREPDGSLNETIETLTAQRDEANRVLAETAEELDLVSEKLADRERKLRDYREALKEIRLSLESSDLSLISAATGEEQTPSDISAAE